MPQGISPNPLNKISEVYLSQISEHHKKDADGNTIPHEGEEVEEGAGLYANIHAKRKRGGKMRKKGDKGAPSSQDFANAARTAKEETEIGEAKVDQGKDDAAKINTRNQRAFGNRRKMLRQSLKEFGGSKLLKLADIKDNLRAQDLSTSEFCKLSNLFAQTN